MDILGLILTAAFIVRTIRNTLYHLFWWQMKEYRFDRMLVHLRETWQGKRWVFGRLSLVKWLLMGAYLFQKQLYLSAPEDITILRYYDIKDLIFYAVFLVYLGEAFLNVRGLGSGWKIPEVRPKSIGLFLLVLGLQFWGLGYLERLEFLENLGIRVLVLDKLLGPMIGGLVLGINIPFEFYKKWLMRRAKRKMVRVRNLRVVGVTGSYGKTTTKEFIAQILRAKFKVLKTTGSQNTDIGIAELILRTNLRDYEIFVCEMAAYHRGEIRQICEMVKPYLKVAVVTGINEQHQSLFGGLENTKRAKFELVEALSKEGLAVFNGKNKFCQEMAERARGEKLRVREMKPMRLMRFMPKVFRKNLALAVAVAREFGMMEKEIRKAVEKLELPPKTMNIVKKGNLVLIDDTFNANPDGVLAALRFLEEYGGRRWRKIFVLQPLIELGKYAEGIHEKIGEKAARVSDFILLTNRNFYQGFIRGARKVRDGEEKVTVGGELAKIKKGVILFEGKETEKYLKKIKKEKSE